MRHPPDSLVRHPVFIRRTLQEERQIFFSPCFRHLNPQNLGDLLQSGVWFN